MTERCILKWCGNAPSDNIFLLSFPKNEEKFTNWCRILNIDKSEVQKHEKAKVCSYHFKAENIKAPISKLSDDKNKINTIVSQNSNENVVEIIQTDHDCNQTINTEENNTLFESPQVEFTKSFSDVIDTEDPLGISDDNDDNDDVKIDYNLLKKIKGDEMDFDDNDTKVDDDDDDDNDYCEKDDDFIREEEDDDDDVFIVEDEVNDHASVSQSSSSMVTRSSSLRSNNQNKNSDFRTYVKCYSVTKATNTPKAFFDEDKIKERYLEKHKNRSENIELLKKQLKIKQDQFDEIKNRIKELKKKKFENNRIMELLKNENESKVAMQILLNLIENDDDYSEKSSFPKEIQELSTNLYTCSPQAYDLIRETFKNAFPSPQKIEDYIKTSKVKSEDLEKLK